MTAITNTPRLRLRITAAAESILRAGHPWLYASSIHEQNRPGEAGELAVIYDRQDRFLAIGLFDPDSPLRVRVLHSGKPVTIDLTWWQKRLEAALQRRAGLFDESTNGYRCIHGESDGWPGLVLDRYDSVYVLKLYTAAWLPRLTEVTRLIQNTIKASTLVLRLSRNIQAQARSEYSVNDGQVLYGEPIEQTPTFLETGIRFEAEVIRGQKTGFFLDQRDNRRRVEKLTHGAEVLNAFSFSGGFSLYAARGGARSVTDLDISAHALNAAARNFELNTTAPNIANCRHAMIQADAFEWLAAVEKPRFDVVIIDPPSLAKRESERTGAIEAYRKLASSGLKALRAHGTLVAASCSAHVSAAEFFDAVRSAAKRSGRPFSERETTKHPPDHPATFSEAEYLKCIYLSLNR